MSREIELHADDLDLAARALEAAGGDVAEARHGGNRRDADTSKSTVGQSMPCSPILTRTE